MSKAKVNILRQGKGPELTGRIVVPGDSQYNAARREFNTFFNKFPLVIVFAQETQDLINAVRWARHWDVPSRMRSGRHNYEGLSIVDAGIVIDVSDMKRVEVGILVFVLPFASVHTALTRLPTPTSPGT